MTATAVTRRPTSVIPQARTAAPAATRNQSAQPAASPQHRTARTRGMHREYEADQPVLEDELDDFVVRMRRRPDRRRQAPRSPSATRPDRLAGGVAICRRAAAHRCSGRRRRRRTGRPRRPPRPPATPRAAPADPSIAESTGNSKEARARPSMREAGSRSGADPIPGRPAQLPSTRARGPRRSSAV